MRAQADVQADVLAEVEDTEVKPQQPEPEPKPQPKPEPIPEPEPEPEAHEVEPAMDAVLDGQMQANTSSSDAPLHGADWAEPVWGGETAEMEFVDEIRARQIGNLVRSGRLPVPVAPHGGGPVAQQTARAPSPRVRSRSGGRPTSRGFRASLAAGGAGGAAESDIGIVPRPPPKKKPQRPNSPTASLRPGPPPKGAGHVVKSGRAVRGRTAVATAPVCV